MSSGIQTTLRGLLQRHGAILVPLIQRDYAQGRRDEEDVRTEFVESLASALMLPADDPALPLNLDFVYGSIEGPEPRTFQPLDGQQRLTTLFLLHWYCAWQDVAWADFENVFIREAHASRFTYQVRTSSAEFFDGLVCYRPSLRPVDVSAVSELITDQPWYFRSWRLDPTVQSILVMLDALHKRLIEHTGLFQRLLDLDAPAITFQLLDLENFGLSDDLYIKMNARGKPLTQFETFKARYEQDLAANFPDLRFNLDGQSFSAADYLSRRLDTVWADLFWSLRDSKSDSYDAALMNVIRAVALISRDPDSPSFISDVNSLRGTTPNFSDFHSKNWLDRRFTLTLVALLDAWSGVDGRLATMMRTATHFDERATFDRIVKMGGSLQYVTIVMFGAYASFLELCNGPVDTLGFEKWMRVVANLSINTAYNRPDDYRRSAAGLLALAPHAFGIEEFLAESDSEISGFSEPQIEEEKLKARLFIAQPSWRPLFDRAEGHPYFRGQIEFLLRFSGIVDADLESAPSSWSDLVHKGLQERFLHYLSVAEQMFSAQGLRPLEKSRWERALLSLGDYLMPLGRNLTFLINSASDSEGSWKRFLRGTSPQKRDLLRRLWECLRPHEPLEPQLDAIIAQAGGMEHWRAALVKFPEMIGYCEDRCIRFEADVVYLLKRTQLNGAHFELTSYEAFLRNSARLMHLASVELDYVPTFDSHHQPSLRIRCKVDGHSVSLFAFHWAKDIIVSIDFAVLQDLPTVTAFLESLDFKKLESNLRRSVGLGDFDQWLTDFNRALAERENAVGSH
jgi:hypothetical protein